MIKKIVKLLLIIIWMGVIFFFSNDTANESNKKSDSIIIYFAERFGSSNLSSKEKKEVIAKYVVMVRKTAHFLVYFILGLLIISFVKEIKIINSKTMAIALLICFGYACSDEFHQLFIRGRSGQLIDVMIDTSGAFLSIYLYQKIYFWRQRKLK